MLWIEEAWSQIVNKVKNNSKKIGANFVHASNNGKYEIVDSSWWTSSFWPGILLKVYELSKDEDLLSVAANCENKMDELFKSFYSLDHDIGFMWILTSVARYKLLADEDSRRRGLIAANFLMGRFNVNGKFIRAWNNYGNETRKNGWSIIDTMMNLSLLFWASEEIKDPRFKGVALSHADMVINNFIREDGSVHHIVEFNPETGERTNYYGGQGYAPDSSWARGTAWAIYGFSICYHYTKEIRYLNAALKVANFFIRNLPEDYVPVWDLKLPGDVKPNRDSSAACIASSGLLLLSEELDDETGAFYRNSALKILESLYKNYGNWDSNEEGMILHGVSHFPAGNYIDNPLIYGDYFFVEAIAKLKGSKILFW